MAYPRVQTNRGELRIHESLDSLNTDLANYICELSQAAVNERGVFNIVFSRGSYLSILGKLTQRPYDELIDWKKWHVFWTDEQLVSSPLPDGNFFHVMKDLYRKVDLENAHPFWTCFSAEEIVSKNEPWILELVVSGRVKMCSNNNYPKFDLILLEMGPDGRVASLFPNHSALGVKDWIAYFNDYPEPPLERIIFTLPVINSASNVVMIASGSDRAEAVRHAIKEPNVGPSASPARRVQPTQGKLVWFLDKQAASNLEEGVPDYRLIIEGYEIVF
ncbi:unnamed protein product [Amaranthus hypochondriacus]